MEKKDLDKEFFHPLDKLKKSIVYGLYVKLNSYEKHFYILQAVYRSLATTWLFATYIGIGFLFSIGNALPINIWIASILVNLGGILGIYTLWQLDLFGYQRQLQAVLMEEIDLENRFSFLPKTRINMKKVKEGKRIKIFQGIFYVACNAILMLTIMSFIILGHPEFGTAKTIFYFVLSFLVSCFVIVIMILQTKNINRCWDK